MTSTGTTVNNFHTEEILEIVGSHLGIAILPSISFTTAIPAVMTTKTTASATDNADVYLSESARWKTRAYRDEECTNYKQRFQPKCVTKKVGAY